MKSPVPYFGSKQRVADWIVSLLPAHEHYVEPFAGGLSVLLAEAETSGEINALTRVARRAGFLWRCPSCREDCYPNRDTCCGKPRPAGDDDA